MKRHVAAFVTSVAFVLAASFYVGYIELGIKAASELRWDKRYQESVTRLERLLPLAWLDFHKRQVTYKLALNYRDLGQYDAMRSMGIHLERAYPGSIEGYYGVMLQAHYLATVERRHADAIELYMGLLNTVKPHPNQETLNTLRQSIWFEMALDYHELGDAAKRDETLAQLKREYPQSAYLQLGNTPPQ